MSLNSTPKRRFKREEEEKGREKMKFKTKENTHKATMGFLSTSK
jgi:hypothetical protein